MVLSLINTKLLLRRIFPSIILFIERVESMENVFDILEKRGFIEQLTHPKEIKELLSKGSVPFYIGIDPTADSLHVGHFVSLMVASHLQKHGHKPIILVGGGQQQ